MAGLTRIAGTVFGGLNRLPIPLRRVAVTAGYAGLQADLRRLATPKVLTLFVTNRCDLRCAHCFLWKHLNDSRDVKDELTLDEIRRLARSLRSRLATLLVTGGEPFLRRDLPEICALFDREARTRQVTIPTNGSQPARIESQIRRVLADTDLDLSVQVSLDGLRQGHDRRRGLDGSFDLAVETVKRLRGIAQQTPRLRCLVTTVLSIDNLDEVVELRRLVIDQFQVGHNVQTVRGSHSSAFGLSPLVASDFEPDQNSPKPPLLPDLAAVDRALDDALGESPTFYECTDIIKRRHIFNVAATGRRPFPCLAGRLDAVVLADGQVAICEMTVPFADLHDFDFDFYALWRSPAADRMRRLTQACACTHSCNISNSMKYDLHTLLALAGLGPIPRAPPVVRPTATIKRTRIPS